DGLIKVVVPPGAPGTIVDVTVFNSAGALSTLEGAFSYEESTATPLRVTAVSPGVATTDGGAVAIIEGDGFVAGMAVDFGAEASANVNVVSSSTMTALVPAAASPGLVDVTVTRPDLQRVVAESAFGYMVPGAVGTAPLVDRVSP